MEHLPKQFRDNFYRNMPHLKNSKACITVCEEFDEIKCLKSVKMYLTDNESINDRAFAGHFW